MFDGGCQGLAYLTVCIHHADCWRRVVTMFSNGLCPHYPLCLCSVRDKTGSVFLRCCACWCYCVVGDVPGCCWVCTGEGWGCHFVGLVLSKILCLHVKVQASYGNVMVAFLGTLSYVLDGLAGTHGVLGDRQARLGVSFGCLGCGKFVCCDLATCGACGCYGTVCGSPSEGWGMLIPVLELLDSTLSCLHPWSRAVHTSLIRHAHSGWCKSCIPAGDGDVLAVA